MKLSCSILFSLMIFFSGSKNLLYLLDYHVNRDFYESVCENKNRPEMECHGKCQVSKGIEESGQNFSFSSFGFDFHFIPAHQSPSLILELNLRLPEVRAYKTNEPFWQRILLSIPSPPPDFNYSRS